MAWATPVIDRTAEDVKNRTAKAYCNVGDLNRLESNCAELAGLLKVSIATKLWVRTDFPTAAQLSRIHGNIVALRSAWRVYAQTPDTPENPLNTWEKWNAAERILADLYDLYQKTMAATLRTGEGFAGDLIGVI